MKNSKRIVYIVLFVLLALLIVARILFRIRKAAAGKKHNDVTETVTTSAVNETTKEVNENPDTSENDSGITGNDISGADIPEGEVSGNTAEAEPEAIENPYKEYFLKNSDMIAWIQIPGTKVDFPVMWTPEDETYYLYKDFDGNYDKHGTPLMDTDSSMYPNSTNLIIHGHNFKNDGFYFLYDYADEDFCREHSLIYLYGKDKQYIYEVMAVFRSKVYYTTDTCFKYYKFFNAESEEEFNDFYDNVKALSLYDTGVTAEYGDKFITLSTCSSHTENGRFVVVGKEIESGDVYIDPYAD